MAPIRRTLARTGALAASLAALACSEVRIAPRPPVLLVVLDTVRADRTSSYGYGRPTTIQLDAVARAGVVFEDVTAPACWTWPSHASLFTGEAPWVHGARDLPVPGRLSPTVEHPPVGALRPDLPTLAERLAAAGYRTAAFVANDWLRPELGLLRGFETARDFETDAAVVDAARAAIEQDDGRPLFLFVNLMAAHSPYREGASPWSDGATDRLERETPPAWARPYLSEDEPVGIDLMQVPEGEETDGVTRFLAGELRIPPEGFELLSRLYDNGVRLADFGLGRVVEAWVRHYDSGVVAVTSDHGEALGEHGRLYHLASVYPEVLRVPLVLVAPGLPAGARVGEPVSLQDLHGTLLELAGVEARPESLARVARGERGARPIAAAAWPSQAWAKRIGGPHRATWRLFREGDRALVWSGLAPAELYDVPRDPGMQHDLAARDPAAVRALAARARAWFEGGPTYAGRPLEIAPATSEQLRALGYLRH